MDTDTKIKYEQYRNKSIINNILFCASQLFPVFVFVLFYVIFMTGNVFNSLVFVMVFCVSILYFIPYFIKNNLFSYLNEYFGTTIFFGLTLAALSFECVVKKDLNLPIETYNGSVSLFLSALCLTLIQNPKYEIALQILCKLSQLLMKIYFKDDINLNIILDYFVTITYFSLISWYVNSVNINLFLSFTNNIKNSIKELSKGMDQISENLCMLEVNNKNSKNQSILQQYQISSQFLNYFIDNSKKNL